MKFHKETTAKPSATFHQLKLADCGGTSYPFMKGYYLDYYDGVLSLNAGIYHFVGCDCVEACCCNDDAMQGACEVFQVMPSPSNFQWLKPRIKALCKTLPTMHQLNKVCKIAGIDPISSKQAFPSFLSKDSQDLILEINSLASGEWF